MKFFSNLFNSDSICIKATKDMTATLAYNQVTGNKRDLQNALSLIKDIFESVNAEYVIGGAIAYGLYAKARSTNDVDVFSNASTIKKVLQELDKRNIEYIKEDRTQYVIPKGKANRSDFDILIGYDEAHTEIMLKPNQAEIFGVKVPVTRPEGLLWNYLISINDNLDKAKKAQHTADAINLIRTGKVKLQSLIRELEETDFELLLLLNELIEDSKSKGSYASTQENMRKRKEITKSQLKGL